MSFSLNDFIAGWGAGVCGLLVGHPADTIKVRQQVARDSRVMKILVSTVKHEGIRGLYKGMLFPLLSAGALNSLFFGVYANTLRFLQDNQNADTTKKTCSKDDQTNKLWHYNVYFAGCVGGFAQFFIASPVDIVKIKIQTEHNQLGKENNNNIRKCMKSIYSHSGWKGFYRGYNIMLWRDVPASGLYVLIYEHFLSLCHPCSDGTNFPIYCQLLAGGLAGTLSWISIIPFDVVKSRIQADRIKDPVYKGVKDCFIKSYKAEGIQVFGRGFWMVSLRAFPVNAATFVGYEWCLQGCNKLEKMME